MGLYKGTWHKYSLDSRLEENLKKKSNNEQVTYSSVSQEIND